MRIVRREEWGARYADGFGPAPLPAPDGLFLHHSVTPAPRHDLALECRAMRALERIGQERFGAGISYTFAIMPSGRVFEGHSIDRRGAHTKGRNSRARAVVLVGDYSRVEPTEAQYRALVDLLELGVDRGWWSRARLAGGHRDVVPTTECPGDAAYPMVARVNRRPAAPAPAPSAWHDADVAQRWLDPRDGRTQYAVTASTMVRLRTLDDVRAMQELGLVEPGAHPRRVDLETFTAHLERTRPPGASTGVPSHRHDDLEGRVAQVEALMPLTEQRVEDHEQRLAALETNGAQA